MSQRFVEELRRELHQEAAALRPLLEALEKRVRALESDGFDVTVHQDVQDISEPTDCAPRRLSTFTAELKPRAWSVRSA